MPAEFQQKPHRALPADRKPVTTRRGVLIADKVADWTITVGGMAVILAVAGIMMFLLQVVVPLFAGGSPGKSTSYVMPTGGAPPLATAIDEYKTIAAIIQADGHVVAFHVGSGRPIEVPSFDFADVKVTAFGRTLDGENVGFGFADGTVRFGQLKLVTRVLPAADLPAGLSEIDNLDATDGHNIYRKLPGHQIRVSAVELTLERPQAISEAGAAIVALDYRVTGGAEHGTKSFVTVDAKGVLRLSRAESKTNMLTGKLRTTVETSSLPPLPAGAVIGRVILTEAADQILVSSGSIVYRYDTRNFDAPVLAEAARIFSGSAGITAFAFLIGEQSIVIGGSDGSTDVYFRLARPNARGTDGYELVRAHHLDSHAGAVVAISPSQRGKTMATMDDHGQIWLRHSTSEQTLFKFAAGDADDVILAPRGNGALAISSKGRATLFDFDAPHPETTLATIFGKVWYEG